MIKRKKLCDGITLVTEQIPYVQSVSIGIWVKVGSIDEKPEYAGISHLIEHMMFKGTEKRTAKEIAEDVDKIGGQMNAFTGKEATCYYIKTIASNTGKAAEILIDMIANSKFDEDELAKEKRVIFEEMKMIQDAPDEDSHENMVELVFNGNPLNKSIIGTPETVGSISSEKIREYISEEYTRDNIVVAAAGNFDENKLTAAFEGKLNGFAEAKKAKREEIKKYVPKFKVKVKKIEQSHICMAVPGVRLDDERYYALSLLSFVVGGSMSSRLFQKIREERGLAYAIYSSVSAYKCGGYFEICAGTAHEKLKEVIYAIKDELKELAENCITEEELETAKEQVKSIYIFGQENINGRMFAMGKNMTILNEIITNEEIIAKYNAVTMEEIKEISKQITDFAEYSAVAVTDREIPLETYVRE